MPELNRDMEILGVLRFLLEGYTEEKGLHMAPDTKADIDNSAGGGLTGPAQIADRDEERGKNVATPVAVYDRK